MANTYNKWADNLQVSLDSEQSKIREAKPENRAGIKKRIVMLESLVVKKRNMANNLLGLDEMSEPSFWQRISDWVIGFAIGAVTTLVLTTI